MDESRVIKFIIHFFIDFDKSATVWWSIIGDEGMIENQLICHVLELILLSIAKI